jgi:alpha-beta hydrolase superfamily lysophospholipase
MGPGGGQAVIDDLHELRAAAAVRFGADVPMCFFGHSMGSMIGIAYLTQHSAGLAAGILCGFPLDIHNTGAMAPILQSVAESAGRDAPAVGLLAANNAPFEPSRTPFDWLSRDAAEVDAYIADPYCGDNNPLTFGYLLDLFDVLAPVSGMLASIACPVLVIAGDQDPAADMGGHPRKLAQALDAAGVRADLVLYPDARHELLNETNRDDVTADIIEWLDAQLR